MLIIAIICAVFFTLLFGLAPAIDLILFILKKGYYHEERHVYSKKQQANRLSLDFALISMGIVMATATVYLLQRASVISWGFNPNILALVAILFVILASFLFYKSKLNGSDAESNMDDSSTERL